MTSERSGDIYLALTRIVILNRCHHLLKEQISSVNLWLISELETRDLLPESGDLAEVPTWRIETILPEFRDRKRAEIKAKMPTTISKTHRSQSCPRFALEA